MALAVSNKTIKLNFHRVFIREQCGSWDEMCSFSSTFKECFATAAGKHLTMNSSTFVDELLLANVLLYLSSWLRHSSKTIYWNILKLKNIWVCWETNEGMEVVKSQRKFLPNIQSIHCIFFILWSAKFTETLWNKPKSWFSSYCSTNTEHYTEKNSWVNVSQLNGKKYICKRSHPANILESEKKSCQTASRPEHSN